jgi:glutamate synthase (NADPH/NADH) large chain
MGDGAGILIQIPDQLYREEMAKQGVELPPAGEYGVGMIFLPKEHASRLACEQEMERAIKAEGQVLLGWRDVPVNRDMPMSPTVREKEPILRQVFIGRGADVIVQDALERKLYVIRKTASAAIQNLGLKHSKEYYVPSMSSRTVVYKGLLLADQVGVYYRTWPTSAASRPSAWCTSASPPTPSPSGRWPTPTAMWPTTVKSTPCAATTTGCWRAKA